MNRSVLIAIVCAAAAATWILSGQFAPDEADTATGAEPSDVAEAGPDAEPRPAPLQTVRVRPMEAEAYDDLLILYGRTVADRSVQVRAQTAGAVADVAVERGAPVAAGDPLIRLVVDDRQARVTQAQALVAQREIEYAAAERLNRSGYRSDTDLAGAQASLDAARADLELARLELARTEITAPFGGRVDDRMVELGDYVEVGQDIATIVDLDPIRVVGHVSERHLGAIGVGRAGTARLLDGSTADGVIAFVGATANERTRTFPVELEIANPDGDLIEGVTAEIQIPLARIMAHNLSPGILTLSDDGQIGVRAVNDRDIVTFHAVEIISGTDSGVWVTGLPETLDVIVVGQDFVSAGQTVRPSVDDADADADADRDAPAADAAAGDRTAAGGEDAS